MEDERFEKQKLLDLKKQEAWDAKKRQLELEIEMIRLEIDLVQIESASESSTSVVAPGRVKSKVVIPGTVPDDRRCRDQSTWPGAPLRRGRETKPTNQRLRDHDRDDVSRSSPARSRMNTPTRIGCRQSRHSRSGAFEQTTRTGQSQRRLRNDLSLSSLSDDDDDDWLPPRMELPSRHNRARRRIRRRTRSSPRRRRNNSSSDRSPPLDRFDEDSEREERSMNRHYRRKHRSEDRSSRLERVSIPVFAGDKAKFESWLTAFSVVDESQETGKYKMLRLVKYVDKDIAYVIEDFGYTDRGYRAAINYMIDNYGGTRRSIHKRLRELRQTKQIRHGHSGDLKRLSHLVKTTILNITTSGRKEDLNDSMIYSIILSKIPRRMLTTYYEWMDTNDYDENVRILSRWLEKQSRYATMAEEEDNGPNDYQSHDRPGRERERDRDRNRERNRRAYVTVDGTEETAEVEQDSECEEFAYYIGQKFCKICKVGQHAAWNCEEMKKKSLKERWKVAEQERLCFRCLSDGHTGVRCSRSRPCQIDGCTRTHHRLLHRTENDITEKPTSDDKTQKKCLLTETKSERSSEQDDSSYLAAKKGTFIALRTVPVVLQANGKSMRVNALLDDASTQTYINKYVIKFLGLEESEPEIFTVGTLNGELHRYQGTGVSVDLHDVNNTMNLKIEAVSADKVTGKMKVIDWNQFKNKWAHLKDIEFPIPSLERPYIELLIGSDYLELHQTLNEVCGITGKEPAARLTPLGWTCVGSPEDRENEYTNFVTYYTQKEADMKLHLLVQNFWQIEHCSGTDTEFFSVQDQEIMNFMEKKVEQTESGRYKAPITWKSGVKLKSDNFENSNKRLISLEKRLRKLGLLHAYHDIIMAYVTKDYLTCKGPYQKINSGQRFSPHFILIRPDRETTKIRKIEDAAAVDEYNMSLNDAIHQGPALQQDIRNILIRFRRFSIALVCDISEMYLKCELFDEDKPYFRFLWRGLDITAEPLVYEFNRVIFGVNCSPFLAQYISQLNARQHAAELPLASKTVLESTYMDDSVDSAPDLPTAIELYHQLKELWSRAGMTAHKWLSNSPEVMSEIPIEDRAKKIDLAESSLPNSKTLGVIWDAEADVLTFSVEGIDYKVDVTKRNLLKVGAKLFDIIGALTPYLVNFKDILQSMWAAGSDWDARPPDSIVVEAKMWLEDLPNLEKIRIPRSLRIDLPIKYSTLHTYTDASEKAYCCVSYLRTVYANDEVSVRLVNSKSKIAPLESVSIQRLELMGAVLGTHLSVTISKVLELPIEECTVWTDNRNVICWVRNRSRIFKPFVSSRIGEIHRHLDPKQLRWVPTAQNPADVGSRGSNLTDLAKDSLWWNGPKYLLSGDDDWPETKVDQKEQVENEIKRQHRTQNNYVIVKDDEEDEWRLDPSRFSNFGRLIRVRAYVTRFIHNCRTNDERLIGVLSREEITDSSCMIIREAQMESFGEDYYAVKKGKTPKDKALQKLTPIVDDDNLLRGNTRLVNADYLPYDVRYPVLLPKKHPVTTLIIREAHEKLHHAGGTNQVLCKLNRKFWLLGGREDIRRWEVVCAMCKRRKAKPGKQIMAPLPEFRITPSLKAFSEISIDLAGPFYTKQGRGKPRCKRYLCLFNCLKTRAVHLEMTWDMSTDDFLNAFNREVNRRGKPKLVWTDNGSNFIGAEGELKELYELLDKEKVAKMAANDDIEWKFGPPLGPHFSGVHETLIKSAKRATYAILSNADITDQELITAFTAAEAMMNARPLTYQSANPNDIVPLTPNHFLHGQAGGELAPQSVDETPFNLRKSWRRLQELMKHNWQRWMKEWIPTLSGRLKWTNEMQNFGVDDVVVIASTESRRNDWELGRITEIFPGKDGKVRVVNVKSAKGSVLTRPISQLCLLEKFLDED